MDVTGRIAGEVPGAIAQEALPPADLSGSADVHAGAPSGPVAGSADGTVRALEPANIRAESIAWWILTACVSGSGLVTLGIVWAAGATTLWRLAVAAAWAAITGLLALAAVRWPRIVHRHAS